MQEVIVIKIGGNIIDNEQALHNFLSILSSVQQKTKKQYILIHGGGKLATKLASDLGIEQQMIDGRRITGAETLKIVTMVYAGYINKNIVAQLQSKGTNAVGLTGADGNIIQSEKRKHATIDYGFVGDIKAVNTAAIKNLLSQFDIVVIAPITHDGEGQLLNTNADTVAQAIATSIAATSVVHLVYSFEKEGVLLDVNNDNSIIATLNKKYYDALKVQGSIFAGMLPKLDNAFDAINKGVSAVTIGKAEKLEALIAGEAGTRIIHE